MNLEKTIATIFFVPSLGITKDVLTSVGFINGYLHDIDREIQYEDAVYLLFKIENMDMFRDFLEKEYESELREILDDYDYGENYTVVVYKLPEKFKEDYKLILLGKYSKTSQDYQNSIPKTISIPRGSGFKTEESLQHRIFNKSRSLIKYWEDRLDMKMSKDQELWEIYDITNETLNISVLLKNEN